MDNKEYQNDRYNKNKASMAAKRREYYQKNREKLIKYNTDRQKGILIPKIILDLTPILNPLILTEYYQLPQPKITEPIISQINEYLSVTKND